MPTKYKGYTGRVLDIDLSTGKIGEYPVSDIDRERFLGGRFLSTKILWDLLEPGIDPLSEKNVLVVMTSPMTGTGAPSSSRFDISAKSPLTGAIGHSNSGGDFGIRLKRAGFDGIVIRGKASSPACIVIEDGEARIEDATGLWGKTTKETEEALGKGGTLVIGPAGENLVKYAAILAGERVHGRTGMGAVMGSKNLKGIVARGSGKIEISRPDKFKKKVKKWYSMLQSHPATGDLTPKYGTAQFVKTLSAKNALPTRNFSRGVFEGAENISGERLAEEFMVKNTGCTSCPIRCGRVVELDGEQIRGPEFETLCLMGSNLEIDDMDAIIRWNREMDLLGMDTITFGNTIGFAAELNEKGLWDNGIKFGDKKKVSELIRKVAYREDIGDELAEGVRFLSEKYGGKEFAAHSKGLEIAGYEPRAAVGHALGYATANRGACHLDGGYVVYFEVNGPMTLKPRHHASKPAWTVLDQNLLAAISAAGHCLFTAWTFVPSFAYKLPSMPRLSSIVTAILTYTWFFITMLLKLPPALLKIHLPLLPHPKLVSLVTGMKMDFGRFLKVGERGYNLERLFNIREGLGKKDDTLAARFTREPIDKSDPNSVVRLDKMLAKYYKLRGWNPEGIPTRERLQKLDIDFIDPSYLH